MAKISAWGAEKVHEVRRGGVRIVLCSDGRVLRSFYIDYASPYHKNGWSTFKLQYNCQDCGFTLDEYKKIMDTWAKQCA